MGLLEWGARYCAQKLDENDQAERLPRFRPSDEIELIPDLAYLPDGSRWHQLDLCYPKGKKGPFPLVVDIHGGALIYGYKELNREFAFQLAGQGFIVASLNYRLIPETRFDGQIQDICAALCWLAEHQRDYPIAAGSVSLTGDSAGSLLAVYTALAQNSPRVQQAFQVRPAGWRIAAMGLSSGLYFVTEAEKFLHVELNKLQSLFFGRGYTRKPFYPFMDLRGIPERNTLPPCYLVSSDEDPLRYQNTSFARMLELNQVPYQFRYWEKNPDRELNHIFNVAYPDWEESQTTLLEMTDFFHRYGDKSERAQNKSKGRKV